MRNVGGGCYDRFVIAASSHFADGHLEALAGAASKAQVLKVRAAQDQVAGAISAILLPLSRFAAFGSSTNKHKREFPILSNLGSKLCARI